MSKKLFSTLIFFSLAGFATVVFLPEIAQAVSIGGIAEIVANIVRMAIAIVIGLAVLGFLLGVYKYFFSGGYAEGIEEGRKYMIYGIIGLFVMVSIWGLVGILSDTFFQDQSDPLFFEGLDLYLDEANNGSGTNSSGGAIGSLRSATRAGDCSYDNEEPVFDGSNFSGKCKRVR